MFTVSFLGGLVYRVLGSKCSETGGEGRFRVVREDGKFVVDFNYFIPIVDARVNASFAVGFVVELELLSEELVAF